MALNQSLGLRAAVGAQPGAFNERHDVENVQRLLNEHAGFVGFPPLPVNGMVSLPMIEAIRQFQKKVVGKKFGLHRPMPSEPWHVEAMK